MSSSEWAVSHAVSHLALVSEADFVAVQGLRATRECRDGATRRCVLAGLVQCQLCGRRMDSHWVNDRAGYRCRHGYNSSRTRPPDTPHNLYVREDVLLYRLVRHLAPDRCRSEADVEPGVVAEIVARLRAESNVIICGRSDWTVVAAE
jgi:site-specific DNA recombinase